MRVEGEPAFILHQRPYRETSSIIELFSRNHGRISVVAKGVRRHTKKAANAPMPFQLYVSGWSGRSDLVTLTQLEPEGKSARLDGDRLYCGLYVNELLMRMLHQHDPHEFLFSRYIQILELLETEESVQPSLRLFERDLLSELGYGLVLDHDIQNSEALDPEAMYEYVVDAGPRRQGVAPTSGVVVKGSSLIALSTGRLEQADQAEVRSLMRAVIDSHLNGKPLHSRKMMQLMKKNTLDTDQSTVKTREQQQS